MKLRLMTVIFCLGVFSNSFEQTFETNTTAEQDQALPDKIQLIEISTPNNKLTASNYTEKQSVKSVDDEKNQTVQTNQYVRPSKKERFNAYVKNTIGIPAFTRGVVGAGFSTITNSPEEWERNGSGFGKRFASNMGSNAIKQTVIFGLDETLKLDSKYYKSKKKDIGSRFKNAFLSTFTARNTEGKRVIGIPRIAGTYTSTIISRETWYPDRYNYKDGLKSGTISLGVSTLFNFIKEFF